MLRSTTLALTVAAALALSAPASAQHSQSEEGTAMSTPNKSGYAPVNGVELYYQIHGEGEPLVLLHGGFGSIEMFGPNLSALAAGRQVIAVDLQGHGRTLPFDRPMSFEAMATDVSELIGYLGLEKADVMGYSMGGGTALRLAIDHPEVVDRLVVVSTVFAYSGWHDFNAQGMKSIGPEAAEGMKQTPMYQSYAQIAPDVNNWTKLVTQMGKFIGNDYDWSAEVPAIKAPTLLVFGDWDSVRTSHVARFFELLGGGQQDANWDRSGMNANRLAILPDSTHYEIFMNPRLAEAAIAFLDAPATAAR
ncbi:MAG TPA: alpha/beta hydrolase [Devosiaceae bacterium]|jgi:pimeloyl-ACP methyl ester carboxylesterase|nr:alpha/beta hydrolase [Devosiaceae bacterium]